MQTFLEQECRKKSWYKTYRKSIKNYLYFAKINYWDYYIKPKKLLHFGCLIPHLLANLLVYVLPPWVSRCQTSSDVGLLSLLTTENASVFDNVPAHRISGIMFQIKIAPSHGDYTWVFRPFTFNCIVDIVTMVGSILRRSQDFCIYCTCLVYFIWMREYLLIWCHFTAMIRLYFMTRFIKGYFPGLFWSNHQCP